MQIDKLYPTSGTPQYGIETTATFMSIPELVDDMGDQYLMGYVNSDDISLVAPVEIINDGDTVTMSRVSGNFGWGYAQWGYTGSYGPGTLYYDDNGTITRSWGIDYDFSFLNAVEMARVNSETKLIPYISVAAIKSNLIDGYKMTGFQNFSEDTVVGTTLDNFVENEYTIDGWKNMIENDLPIFSGTVAVNGNPSITWSLTLRPSDFEHDNGMKFALIPKDNGYTLHCRIIGLKIGRTQYYYDNTTTIGGNIVPFFQFPDTQENPAIVVPGTFLFSQIDLHYENGGIYVTRGTVGEYYNELFLQGNSDENSRVFGGFDFGTISVNDVDFTQVFSNSNNSWCFVGNYVMISYSKSNGHAIFRVNTLYTPLDIYNYLRLWHKRTDTPSDTYSSEDTVTVFTNSNVPTLRTVSGTLSDIQLDLQPWQYPGIDITENTFTPTDIPDPSGSGKNLIRFGDITPSEFLFGDISIEKIYFGSSLLYQKFVPEQYVTLVPIEKFTTSKYFSNDYRVYGQLSSGEVVLSTRTPRVRNTLPFPYPPAVLISGTPATFPFVYHDDGTISWDTTVITTSENAALRLNMFSLTAPFLYPAGTYTLSVRDYADASAPGLYLQVRPSDGSSMYTLNDSSTHSGVITFTLNKSCYLHAFMQFNSNLTYAAATIYPQLEAGSSPTDYESVNPASLTTIILPREVGETEYISYADQKIMPTGTPITVPKLKTKINENVIMIENYPTATNTILLTPATKEQNN